MAANVEVERGRVAFAAARWAAASSRLEAADRADPLGLDDLELLAVAASLAGRDDTSAAAWSRAHRGRLAAGDACGAARAAFWLAFGLLLRGDVAPASGWLARAQRVLDDAALAECVERAFLLVPEALLRLIGGDADGAYAAFRRAGDLAGRWHDADLTALSTLGQGQALLVRGEQAAATALLDEVMVAVVGDEVSPMVAGLVYCAVIASCREAFDVQRARQWTLALTRWCDAQPELVPFRGQCLVHRCEVLALEGDWPAAAAEIQRACALLGAPPHPALGAAHYQAAELLRVQGQSDAAEAAFARASTYGCEPQPGLALLRLAQGQPQAASTALRRALVEAVDELQRARLLPAMVEVSLATGDRAAAEASAAELGALAEARGAVALVAAARKSSGAVHLAQGRAGEALVALRAAEAAWRVLGAPYEAARVRVLIGRACRQLGDHDGAALEVAAARETFERLGARRDLAELDRDEDEDGDSAMAAASTGPAGPLTRRELEVLVLVASGRTNRAVAAELVISEKTVARHLANIFTKLHLSSRAAATAYAYQHHLV